MSEQSTQDRDISAATELLVDAFERVREGIADVLDGLDEAVLVTRPAAVATGASVASVASDEMPAGNSIAWLVWHLTRVQDDHLAGVAAALDLDSRSEQRLSEQVWTGQGYAQRFGLPYPVDAHGYGQSDEEVAAYPTATGDATDPAALNDYQRAVHERTVQVLRALRPGDLQAVVDDSYDPPVTAAARLISVVNDATQHVGQAAYVRGLLGD